MLSTKQPIWFLNKDMAFKIRYRNLSIHVYQDINQDGCYLACEATGRLWSPWKAGCSPQMPYKPLKMTCHNYMGISLHLWIPATSIEPSRFPVEREQVVLHPNVYLLNESQAYKDFWRKLYPIEKRPFTFKFMSFCKTHWCLYFIMAYPSLFIVP